MVPLSRARCCRPCLPSQLPDSLGQLDPHLDPQGVAIVSIGCHRSTGQGSEALKCEPQGSSFVTGFTEAIRVSNAANYYYPVGAVECCTPSVLLSTGDAWELERCDCSFSTDINCGEQDTNRLLQGFERWRSVIHAFLCNAFLCNALLPYLTVCEFVCTLLAVIRLAMSPPLIHATAGRLCCSSPTIHRRPSRYLVISWNTCKLLN